MTLPTWPWVPAAHPAPGPPAGSLPVPLLQRSERKGGQEARAGKDTALRRHQMWAARCPLDTFSVTDANFDTEAARSTSGPTVSEAEPRSELRTQACLSCHLPRPLSQHRTSEASSFLPRAARTTQNTACRDVTAAAASPRAPEPPRPSTSHPSSRDAAVTRTPPGCNSLQHPLSLGTEHIPWAPTSHQPPAVCDRAHTGLFFQHSAATPAGRRKVGRSQPGAAPPDDPQKAWRLVQTEEAMRREPRGPASITPFRSQAFLPGARRRLQV